MLQPIVSEHNACVVLSHLLKQIPFLFLFFLKGRIFKNAIKQKRQSNKCDAEMRHNLIFLF